MLKIRVKNKSDHEADVYINDSFYPGIDSYPDSDYLFCHNITDFLYLSKYSFLEFIENKIRSVSHNHRHAKNATCFFSYSINTSYKDLAYLEYMEESHDAFEEKNDEPFYYTNKGNYISASLNFKYGEWKKLYSIKEFQFFLHNQILNNDYLSTNATIFFSDKDPFEHIETLTIEFRELDDLSNMSEYLNIVIPTLSDMLDKALIELDSQHSLDIYTSYFRFPEEYKVSCKQYLIYFAQFLLDLGISVDTELKDTTAGTFFSVIPKDKGEALDGIKELLFEYLNAPNFVNESTSISSNTDIAVAQFQATLYHLKSQLAFSNTQIEMKQAIIQSKEATIQSLNLVNYQLSEKIQSQGLRDEESIIAGVVSVTKLEKAGFKINLPEILRRLKRKL